MTNRRIFRPVAGALAAVLIGSALVLGCSSDDDDNGDNTGASQPTSTAGGNSAEAPAVEAAIRGAVQAYGAGNTEQFLSYWTEDGLKEEFDATPAEVRAAGAEFFGGPPIELGSFDKVEVDDDSATAEFDFVFGSVLQPQRYILVQEGTSWKINDTESRDAEIPSNATKIEMNLDEFSFEFDTSKVKTNVAFELDNVGDQPHEAVLLKVPAGFTINQLLEADPSADLPAGVEFLGFAGPYEPGDDGTMVFSKALGTGSYMFVCFLPDTEDPEETPHAAKGMAVTFQVSQ